MLRRAGVRDYLDSKFRRSLKELYGLGEPVAISYAYVRGKGIQFADLSSQSK
jgi:hypothetical protein